MYVQDDLIRKKIRQLLKTRTKNEIVQAIKKTNVKFHQYNLDKFLQSKDINISTLKKLEKYVISMEYEQINNPS